jgi:hypothetical protein
LLLNEPGKLGEKQRGKKREWSVIFSKTFLQKLRIYYMPIEIDMITSYASELVSHIISVRALIEMDCSSYLSLYFCFLFLFYSGTLLADDGTPKK